MLNLEDIHSKSRIFRLIFFFFFFNDMNLFLCRFELVYILLEAVILNKENK